MLEPGLLYFAYGCHLDRDLLARVIGRDPGPGQLARAGGWRLAFNKGGEEDAGWSIVANLMEAEGCFVYGAVYRLPRGCLKPLDEFEGVPDHYRRATLWVEPRGRRARQAALAYIAQPKWVVSEGEPDGRYLDHLVRGAAASGCPAEYLGWVRGLARGEEAECFREEA